MVKILVTDWLVKTSTYYICGQNNIFNFLVISSGMDIKGTEVYARRFLWSRKNLEFLYILPAALHIENLSRYPLKQSKFMNFVIGYTAQKI